MTHGADNDERESDMRVRVRIPLVFDRGYDSTATAGHIGTVDVPGGRVQTVPDPATAANDNGVI